MPRNVVQYDLLISCPGDVSSEIGIIEKAVSQFNVQFSDTLGISIRTKHWQKDSYAQSGGKPQALLNEQFVNDCDAAVAILWTRFGTPTDEYGSGTEEEVEIMLASGKQVFMYFSDNPLSPSQMNEESYKKVQAFRDKCRPFFLDILQIAVMILRVNLLMHFVIRALMSGKVYRKIKI